MTTQTGDASKGLSLNELLTMLLRGYLLAGCPPMDLRSMFWSLLRGKAPSET